MQTGPSHDGPNHTESLHDGSYPMIRAKMSRSSSSLSSSSSSSGYDPLMETDDDENDAVDTKSGHSSSSSTPRARIQSPVPGPAPPMPEWSMISNSPRDGLGPMSPLGHNSDWRLFSSKHPHPVYTLGLPGGSAFEPNRIPSSIFKSKPGNAADWSAASNDSLFSLHMGNNSFSRDFAFLNSKSGELSKSGDWGRPSDAKSPEMNVSSPSLSPLPTVHEVAPEDLKKTKEEEVVESPKKVLIEDEIDSPKKILIEDEIGSTKKKVVEEGEVDSPKKVANEPPHVPPVKESDALVEKVGLSVNVSNVSDGRGRPSADTASTSASTARLSNESGNSNNSFAFPVLSDAGRHVSTIPLPDHTTPPKPPEKPVYDTPPPPETEADNPKEETVTPPVNRWFPCCPCYGRG